jgi:hypothetical protein
MLRVGWQIYFGIGKAMFDYPLNLFIKGAGHSLKGHSRSRVCEVVTSGRHRAIMSDKAHII